MSAIDDTILSLLDRPIAYNPVFARVGGGSGPGVMLSQAWYWTPKTRENAHGWFYKSGEEWQQETGMNRSELESARKALIARGLIEAEKRGVPCRYYYRVNQAVLLEAIKGVGDKPTHRGGENLKRGRSDEPQTSLPETGKLISAAEISPDSATNQNVRNRQTRMLETGKLDGREPANQPAGSRGTGLPVSGEHYREYTESTSETTHTYYNNNAASPKNAPASKAFVVDEDMCKIPHTRNNTQRSETCAGMTAISDVIAPTRRGRPAEGPKIPPGTPVPPPADIAAKLAAGIQTGDNTPAMTALRAAGVVQTKRTNLGDLVARHGEQHVLDLCDAVAKGFVQVDSAAAYLVQKLSSPAPCALPIKYVEDKAAQAKQAQDAARKRVIAEQRRAIAAAEKTKAEKDEARWNALPPTERAVIEEEERVAQLSSAGNEMAKRIALGPIGQGDLRRACIARMSTYKNDAVEPLRCAV